MKKSSLKKSLVDEVEDRLRYTRNAGEGEARVKASVYVYKDDWKELTKLVGTRKRSRVIERLLEIYLEEKKK